MTSPRGTSLAELTVATLGPEGPLAAALPGYEARAGQLAMARRVAEAIDGDERLLCEAGTGTGKTLAYLVPALLSGRKVLIATGSKTLQDQIAHADLPRLRATLDVEVSFAVMKGLSNYVCRRRLHERLRQGVLPGAADATEAQLLRIRDWAAREEVGDRAGLVEVAEEAPIWREVTATPETRLGARCAFFHDCFVTRMRARAADARVVVTNHHLFFADLALRQAWPDAQVLPPSDVVIFDEAHQLEEVATEFFGVHVSTARLHALARDLGRLPSGAGAGEHAATLARRLATLTEELARALRARLPGPREVSEEARVPLPEALFGDPSPGGPRALYLELDAALEETAHTLARLASDGPPALDPGPRPPAPELAALLGSLSRRAQHSREALGTFVEPPRRAAGHAPDDVRWVVRSPRNLTLRSAPVDVAPRLRAAFDAHLGPLLFTSATLSVGHDFGYLRARLGLDDGAAEASFASPFRYQEQALLYLPEDLPDPNQPGFGAAAIARAIALCELSRGRALCLYTSHKSLRAAEAAFAAHGGFPLLVQGSQPRHALLQALRARVGSVLLATLSFWEGVDVPGEALSLVVLDRIPFAAPDEPLVAARCRRIEADGGDAFAQYSLPRAALTLRQGFGRLIRTRRDRGVVALLDGRVLRKGYGATLLQALPPDCPRSHAIEDVQAFFAESGGAAPDDAYASDGKM